MEHIDLFYEGLKRVDFFRVSPGNFLLDPRTDDASRERVEWVLVDETALPKSGVGAEGYLEQIAAAQQELGAPKMSHEEWVELDDARPKPAATESGAAGGAGDEAEHDEDAEESDEDDDEGGGGGAR